MTIFHGTYLFYRPQKWRKMFKNQVGPRVTSEGFLEHFGVISIICRRADCGKLLCVWFLIITLRACLHGSGGPQEGEVIRFGGVNRLSIKSLILIWSRLHDRWGDPPHVTSPIWSPPPPCKQALSFLNFQSGEVSWKIKRLHFAIITSFPWYIHSLTLALDQSARSKPLSYSKKGRG